MFITQNSAWYIVALDKYWVCVKWGGMVTELKVTENLETLTYVSGDFYQIMKVWRYIILSY
jgi:hypothetical protein